jgi:hypothetical protein
MRKVESAAREGSNLASLMGTRGSLFLPLESFAGPVRTRDTVLDQEIRDRGHVQGTDLRSASRSLRDRPVIFDRSDQVRHLGSRGNEVGAVAAQQAQ